MDARHSAGSVTSGVWAPGSRQLVRTLGPQEGAGDPPGHLCEAAVTEKVQREKFKPEPQDGVTAGAFEFPVIG